MQAEYDKAWGYLMEANKLQRDTYSFNPEVSPLSMLLHNSFKLTVLTAPPLVVIRSGCLSGVSGGMVCAEAHCMPI